MTKFLCNPLFIFRLHYLPTHNINNWRCKSIVALFIFFALTQFFNAQVFHKAVNKSRSNYLFTIQNDSNLYFYSSKTKVLFNYNSFSSPVKKILSNPNNNGFFILLENGDFIYFDCNLQVANFVAESISDFTCSDNKVFTGNNKGEIFEIGLNDFHVFGKILTNSGGVTALCINHSESELAFATREGRIGVVNLENYKLKKSNSIFTGEIICLCYNEKDNILFAGTGVLFYGLDENLDGKAIICNYFEFSQIEGIKENLVYLRRQQYGSATTDQISRFIKGRKELFTNESGNNTALCFQKDQFSLWRFENSNASLKIKFYNYSSNIETLHHAGEIDAEESSDDSVNLKISDSKMGILKFMASKDSVNKEIKIKDFSNLTSFIRTKATKENHLEVIPQIGFASPLKYLFFTGDGGRIITMSESPVIKIWDSKTMELIKEICLSEFNVMKAALHPKIPLLVLLDRNYKLHLVDIENLQLMQSFFYTKEKYNYTGDYDGNLQFDMTMEFKFDGALLSIQSKNEGPCTFCINSKTSDLLNGKVKPIVFNEDEFYTQDSWEKRELIFKTVKQERNFYASGTSLYSVFQEKIENTTKYFLKHMPSGNFTEIRDSVFFLDSFLKKPFYPARQIHLPDTLYKKLDHPVILNIDIKLVRTSPKKKFFELKNHKGEVSVYDAAKMNRVIAKSENPVEYLSEEHGILFCSDTVFFTKSGKKESIRKYYGPLRYGKKQNKFIDEVQKFKDEKREQIFFWISSMDNVFLVINAKNENLSVKKFIRPELGKVKPSIFPVQSFINYQSNFSRFDPFSLKLDDYWLKTENVNGTLSFSVFDKKPEMPDTTFFIQRQPSFENKEFNELSSILVYCSISNYFEVLSKSKNFKTSRVLINPVLKRAEKIICQKDDQYCPEDDFYCSYTCSSRLSVYDSLFKMGLLATRLNASQRIAYQKKSGCIEGFARSHGKVGEYDFLGNYGIPIDGNIVGLNQCEDLIDSTFTATIDKRFAISFHDRLKGDKIKTFLPPPIGSYFMHFLFMNEKVLTYGYDGGIRLYDIKSKSSRETYTFFKSGSNNIFITPDNYYKLSGNSRDLIRFRKNDKLYSIEQFDLKLNRPDILLQRAGSKDTALIDSYYKAYLKRLKKMGFNESMLKDDYQLPDIIISPENKIPVETNEDKLTFHLSFKDKKYLLDRINIFVNDVPVYGVKGIDLRADSKKYITKKFEVPLADGSNHIQISVLNQAGAESYKESWTVEKKSMQQSKPNLYLINIGAGKYEDSRFNLKYAAKDAEDINFYFNGEKEKLFNKINSFVITDEKVKRDEIIALKKILMSSNINDMVLITFAGHGVLDKNFDYYLATYNMNFSKPGENGLSYEALESLLDGIPPLKKLLVIDACHSGEVDKEEIEFVNTQNNTEITFRSAGAGLQQRKMGIKSTSELVTELFTDLRKGTGTTIISSSGGTEVSMESDRWQNGLFTYCFLNGLKSGKADLNKDGSTVISELQNFLIDEVTTKSNGIQKPTSRLTNSRQDFRIK